MEVTIGQFAKLFDTTVRTLRYYDKIGLLTPKKYNKNGRKVYTRADFDMFQKIMILKYLGLSLDEIKEQMTTENLTNRDLMAVQKQLIVKKQAELNDMLEVITRMERLYNNEGISLDDLDEFSYILLDLFRREKQQIQILETYFVADKEIMNDLRLLHSDEYKEKMDVKVWHLLQGIKNAIEHNDPASKEKVREILEEMDSLFPTSKNFVSKLIEDDQFAAQHNHEFNNYFPEDIARYIAREMKTYYDDKGNSKGIEKRIKTISSNGGIVQ